MTKPRTVQGLVKVERASNPWPDAKPTGSRAEGLRFQRKVHGLIRPLAGHGTLEDGPWFRYSDRNGTHYCQPDSVLEVWDRVIVWEAKLSLRRGPTGVAQLNRLYKPVLEKFFRKPIVTCLVWRNWIHSIDSKDPFPMIEEPEELLTKHLNDCRTPFGWHVL